MPRQLKHNPAHFFALATLAFLFISCAPKANMNVPKYENPESGKVVDLRPADYIVQEKLEKSGVKLVNPKVQVLLQEKHVLAWVTRVVDGHSENIEMTGDLSENLTAILEDADKTPGFTQRMMGIARCMHEAQSNGVCPIVQINFRFKFKGEKKDVQFIVVNRAVTDESADLAAAELALKNNTPTPKTSDSSPAPKQPTPAFAEEGVGEGQDDNTLNGAYVTPQAAPEVWNNLGENGEKLKLVPAEVPQTSPASNSPGIPSVDFPFDLDGGGKASGFPFTYLDSSNHIKSGAIIDGGGTSIPKDDGSLLRVADESKSFATGYLKSFLEVTSDRFAAAHPECGGFTLGNTSSKFGGKLKFNKPQTEFVNGQKVTKRAHAGHQNGNDADIAYLPLSELTSVLKSNGTVDTTKFNVGCNYERIKYWVSIKQPETNQGAVYLVLVHPKLKQLMCAWAKGAGKNSPEDIETFYRIRPDVNHFTHTHVRMRCSPHHDGRGSGGSEPCWQQSENWPDGTGCA